MGIGQEGAHIALVLAEQLLIVLVPEKDQRFEECVVGEQLFLIQLLLGRQRGGLDEFDLHGVDHFLLDDLPKSESGYIYCTLFSCSRTIYTISRIFSKRNL